MPIDKKVLDFLKDFKPTPELMEEIGEILDKSNDDFEKRRAENARFTSECRCHTGGICYFHTKFM